LEVEQLVADNEHSSSDVWVQAAVDSVFYYQDKFEQAEPLFLRALIICETLFGAEHHSTREVRQNLAYLLWIKKLKTE
jgi:hypothetical protein